MRKVSQKTDRLSGDGTRARPDLQAYVAHTDSGAVLLLCNVSGDARRQALALRGIVDARLERVPLAGLAEKYGVVFDVVASRLFRRAGACVLDVDARRVLSNLGSGRSRTPTVLTS